MAALEEALRSMGIPPVDELLTRQEQDDVHEELLQQKSVPVNCKLQ